MEQEVITIVAQKDASIRTKRVNWQAEQAYMYMYIPIGIHQYVYKLITFMWWNDCTKLYTLANPTFMHVCHKLSYCVFLRTGNTCTCTCMSEYTCTMYIHVHNNFVCAQKHSVPCKTMLYVISDV